MLPEFSANEARVIGSLIEKSVITPDQYPMTLNALVNACNQKSGREPVSSLKPGEVQQTLRVLEGRHLIRMDENFKGRTEKYSQRFCNTRYSNIQFDAAELAIVCLLLLRGSQTPGELRARSGRLHTFADNAAVVQALDGLIAREGGPMVQKLPRTPGRKDSAYMHRFCVAADVQAQVERASVPPPERAPARESLAELVARMDRLEGEVAALKLRIDQD